jgi:hypothetical protein
VNLFCFKQSSFIGDITAESDTPVSWDNYFKGFRWDVSNNASLSSNASSDRTRMCCHLCVFRNLFTSQYTGSLQMNWNTHQLLYFLQPFLCDFFLILVSIIKPYHTPYFIFMNNNNLPLLYAANENKLFWSCVNICEQVFRWWCVREHGATQQLDESHASIP